MRYRPLIRKTFAAAVLLSVIVPASGICEQPKQRPSERAFSAQLLIDLQAGVVSSPKMDDRSEWPDGVKQGLSYKSHSLIVVIEISTGLLDAAVEHWGNGRNVNEEGRKNAIARLRRQFLRSNEKAFLLLVKPIACTNSTDFIWGTHYGENWFSLSLGPIAKNLNLETLDGKAGDVIRAEKTLDDRLTCDSGIKSCLFYVKDIVNRDTDPSFNIVLSNVRHSAKGQNGGWFEATTSSTVRFRFETGEVRVLDKIEQGVPWSDLDTKYLSPKRRGLDLEYGSKAVQLLLDLGRDLLVQLILKGL